MNITVNVDTIALRQALKVAPEKVKAGLNGWVNTTALMTEREAKLYLAQHVSLGATGGTGNSIHTFPSDLQAEVKPTQKTALWVHEGRKPGKMPPFGEGTPLNGWAKRMGMNPFLVARAIGRKGTKGIPFMDEAYKIVKPTAERNADIVLGQIVSSI